VSEQERTCPDCQQTYPRTPDYWHRNKATKDGLNYVCKDCNRRKSAIHHATPRLVVDGQVVDRRRVTNTPLEKACTNCGAVYPRTREYWPPYKKNADKLSSWCKTCHAKDTRATQLKYRTQVLAHYSGGTPCCACCGEAHVEFLSIDHINGGGRAHRIELRAQGTSLERYLVRSGFPEGFRVLCHNCNQAIGYLGYCPIRRSQPSQQSSTIQDAGAMPLTPAGVTYERIRFACTLMVTPPAKLANA
jgi:hypothetical protein